MKALSAVFFRSWRMRIERGCLKRFPRSKLLSVDAYRYNRLMTKGVKRGRLDIVMPEMLLLVNRPNGLSTAKPITVVLGLIVHHRVVPRKGF